MRIRIHRLIETIKKRSRPPSMGPLSWGEKSPILSPERGEYDCQSEKKLYYDWQRIESVKFYPIP